MFLVSCSNTKEIYVSAPVVPIPAHLLTECELPIIPDRLTWGDTTLLLIDSMSSIAKCNLDKKAIREIEQQRQVMK
ncbi:Rz1-like lysis system protein LysC [Providencia heimbachae]|uniref:Rz1-like lysis system protein LysC n=1 Tax=Providencia heimbachae TaxID=333962 RepID=UPI003C7E6FAB